MVYCTLLPVGPSESCLSNILLTRLKADMQVAAARRLAWSSTAHANMSSNLVSS